MENLNELLKEHDSLEVLEELKEEIEESELQENFFPAILSYLEDLHNNDYDIDWYEFDMYLYKNIIGGYLQCYIFMIMDEKVGLLKVSTNLENGFIEIDQHELIQDLTEDESILRDFQTLKDHSVKVNINKNW